MLHVTLKHTSSQAGTVSVWSLCQCALQSLLQAIILECWSLKGNVYLVSITENSATQRICSQLLTLVNVRWTEQHKSDVNDTVDNNILIPCNWIKRLNTCNTMIFVTALVGRYVFSIFNFCLVICLFFCCGIFLWNVLPSLVYKFRFANMFTIIPYDYNADSNH